MFIIKNNFDLYYNLIDLQIWIRRRRHVATSESRRHRLKKRWKCRWARQKTFSKKSLGSGWRHDTSHRSKTSLRVGVHVVLSILGFQKVDQVISNVCGVQSRSEDWTFNLWNCLQCWFYVLSSTESYAKTVRARIPNIQITNPFNYRTFQNSVFERFGFRMVRTSKYTTGTDHSKTEFSNMAALGQVVLHIKKKFYLYIKRPSLERPFFLPFKFRTKCSVFKWSKKMAALA